MSYERKYERTCSHCGASFLSAMPWAKYHSLACKTASYRSRHAAKPKRPKPTPAKVAHGRPRDADRVGVVALATEPKRSVVRCGAGTKPAGARRETVISDVPCARCGEPIPQRAANECDPFCSRACAIADVPAARELCPAVFAGMV